MVGRSICSAVSVLVEGVVVGSNCVPVAATGGHQDIRLDHLDRHRQAIADEELLSGAWAEAEVIARVVVEDWTAVVGALLVADVHQLLA